LVDALQRSAPGRRSGARGRALAAAVLALSGLVGACGGTRQVIIMGPPVDAGQVALRAEGVTALQEASRIVFSWSLSEQGVRVSGRGVARVEPAYKARLDLFLASGETAARAAMVGDDLRIPPGVPTDILPPSHLLWGTLGVFRPGMGIGLTGGDPLDEGGVRLTYQLPNGDEVRYSLDGSRHIREVEVRRSGTPIQRLTVSRDDGVFPVEAVYRDLASFRELRLARESVEHVEPFPPDIWLR
jgi:hypothetical protein